MAVLLTATTLLAEARASTVSVNGKLVQSDVPPVVENGTTYLPLRAAAEALGATVEWNASAKLAVLCRKSTCYPIRVTDPVSGAKVMNGRVLLPLRKAADALGAKVSWNAQVQRVDVVIK